MSTQALDTPSRSCPVHMLPWLPREAGPPVILLLHTQVTPTMCEFTAVLKCLKCVQGSGTRVRIVSIGIRLFWVLPVASWH
jgi:hypothetical protein